MIIRIESASTKGWQARAYTVAPRYLSKLFSDAKCGGIDAAYALAADEVKKLKRKARRRRA